MEKVPGPLEREVGVAIMNRSRKLKKESPSKKSSGSLSKIVRNYFGKLQSTTELAEATRYSLILYWKDLNRYLLQ